MTDEAEEPVISDGQDLLDALKEKFLSNANGGLHEANDALIRQWNEWKRNQR